MSRLQLIMAGGRYDRTHALIDGSVLTEELDLRYIEELFARNTLTEFRI
jgi:hypothetical protein